VIIGAATGRRPLGWSSVLSTGLLIGAACIWGFGLFDYLVLAGRSGAVAQDFTDSYLPAAHAVMHGRSPYPGLDEPVMVTGQGYVYPPLVAFVSIPLTFVPGSAFVAMALAALCVPLSLWLLDVRDWRCYVAVLLWVPIFSGIVWANVTLPLMLGCATCWRLRDRPGAVSIAGGLTVAAKLLAWPLTVWLASTQRVRAALGVLAVAFAVSLGLWSVIGFAGLADFPTNLHRLDQGHADRVYTLSTLARQVGLSEQAETFVWLGAAVAAVIGVVIFGRRGDDKRSFSCAIVAAIVASPIVWMHSFAFLLVPLALLRPRFSLLWLLPGAIWLFANGSSAHPRPSQVALTFTVAAVVVVGALSPRVRTLRLRSTTLFLPPARP
jgi:alpha-1,2-mannosyltransferase